MQKIISWLKKYDLILILTGTFIFRLPSLFFYARSDFPEFYRDYFMVNKIVSGVLVLSGPGSVLGGYHFSSLYYYLFVPCFIVLNHHPASLLLTSIIFSALTVWGLYRLVFVWTQDIWAARLVGVLYMLSTYSIFLTSFVSNPNFLPTFIVWALYHLTIIVDKRGQLFNFIVLGILVGLASQLHTTALVVLLPLVALTLIFIRTKIEIRNILSLLLAFVASNFLYLYFESSIKFQNLKRLLDLASSNLHGNQALSNLSAIINFFFGSLSPFSRYYSFTNFQFGWMYFIVGMLGLFALLIILKNIFQGKITNKLTFKISRSGVYIIIIWFSLVLLMVLSYNRVVPNHYFVILWPFPIIILGFVVIWISKKFNLKYSLLVFVLLTYIFQIVTYYNSPKESWNNFFQKYDLYKNLPNISEIGNKGYEPYLTPPGEVK